MRISYLIGKLHYGGAEFLLLDIVEGLLEKGHYVQVIYYVRGGLLESKFQALISKRLDLQFINRGAKTDLSFILKIAALIKRTKIDVINGIMPPCNAFGVIAGLLAGIKYRFMSLMASDWDYKKKIDHFIYFHFDHFIGNLFATAYIANSEKGKIFHASKGYKLNKLLVVHNGIKIDKFITEISYEKKQELFKSFGIKENLPIVGMLSRIEPMKDHTTFIRAAEIVHKNNSEIMFMIIGDGEKSLVDKLKDFSFQLGLSNHIIFVGAVEDVALYYKLFDIYVLTSYTEGLPNSLLEAMASGKAVIATDVGDVNKIVENGLNGFVVPPRNPQKIADKISFLLENPHIIGEMGNKGREKIRAHYSINTMISNMIKTYGYYNSKITCDEK